LLLLPPPPPIAFVSPYHLLIDLSEKASCPAVEHVIRRRKLLLLLLLTSEPNPPPPYLQHRRCLLQLSHAQKNRGLGV
jgi:hypothetical protein